MSALGGDGAASGPPLGGDARALLEAARGASGPDAAAVARIKARVNAAVGVGAVAAVGSVSAVGARGGASGPSAGVAGAKHALALKLGATVAIATLAVGFGVWRSRGGAAEVSAPRAIETQASAQRTVAPAARSAASAPVASAPPAGVAIPTTASTPTSATAATAATGTIATAGVEASDRGAPTRPVAHVEAHRADLAREVALVDRAMAALRRGDPRGALAAVRMHAAETAGGGQLAEDAAAIEIEALCAARLPVTAKVATFDARWPRSSQRHRLTTACALEPSE